MLLLTYYARNYAGIIGASLLRAPKRHIYRDVSRTLFRTFVLIPIGYKSCWTGQLLPTLVKYVSSLGWPLIADNIFLDIASPLYSLTQTEVSFSWTDDGIAAFETLKQCFTNAPVLVYLSFCPTAMEFNLHTDASAVGLGAVFTIRWTPNCLCKSSFDQYRTKL